MKIVRERIVVEEEDIPEKLNDFKGWEFSSGPTTGADFQIFARLFRKCIRQTLPPGTHLVNVSTGHYYISGFVQRGDKFVYFSISDVRHFPGEWHRNILVRTAKSEKDYTGGSNGYTALERFSDAMDRLFGVTERPTLRLLV